MARMLAALALGCVLVASATGDGPLQPSIERRGQVIFAAMKASPPATDAIKASLKDIAHVEASYISEPLKHWVEGATVKDGRIHLTETVGLNRDAGGEAPDEWVAQLAAPLAKGLRLSTLRLAPAVSPEARAECNRLLAEADATLRKRLTELAEQFPALKTTNWGTLEEALSAKSKPGEVALWAGRYHGGATGVKAAVAPEDSYNLLVILRPLHWPVPPGEWAMPQLYAYLPIMGQAQADAGDPKLRAELKKLVADVTAPLEELAAHIAAGKPPTTAPTATTAPAEDK